MISRETIDKIFETARIEEVIGDFVQLKKAGSNLKGLSPFSNEKTPSFMVSPAKQIFKDFSSGKGGTVVTFLMEHEHYTYPEALRYLAKKYQIEVEEDQQSDEEKEKRNEKESLFLVNEFASDFFQNNLWETENGRQIGLSYFRERGFSDEIIKEFKLGYSPEEWDALAKAAQTEKYQLEFLEKTGLVSVKEGRTFDRFRGRVIFPILSHTGRTLGFGGRILKSNAKAAKYLNSPESAIYHKSKILYGLYQAKSALSREDECLLTEGYTDVISLHQAGLKNAVASSGTALTREQVLLIKRFTNNINLLFDGDAAGLKASLRSIDLILAEGMNINLTVFPDGEDPDSYARSVSRDELKEFLAEKKVNFLRFKANLLQKEAANDPLEKSRATREVIKSIALVPDALERNAYVQQTARIMDMEERVLFAELQQIMARRQSEASRQRQREKRQEDQPERTLTKVSDEGNNITESPLHVQERALCWLLLNHGAKSFDFGAYLEEDPSAEAEEESVALFILGELQADQLNFEHPHYREILERFREHYDQEEKILNPESFLRLGNSELMHLIVDLVADEPDLHAWEKKGIYLPEKDSFLARFTVEAMLRFKEKKISSLMNKIQTKIQGSEEVNREDLVMAQRLNKLRAEINQRLSRVV